MDYSVLMSVYHKENPVFLKIAIESILNQTFLTNDFVIVHDGNLTKDLYEILQFYKKKYPKIINVVGYKTNKGLGYALNFGLNYCKNEFVMRMDSDDYSKPQRAEIQVNKFILDNVDISSTCIELFKDSPDEIIGKRNVPILKKDIIKCSKTRSPFNHPSAIFKKSKVLAAGGYKNLLFKEDYYLWVRMIQNGSTFNNTKDYLVAMRTDDGTFLKRKKMEVYQSALWLNKYMLDTHYISKPRYFWNKLVYFLRQKLPSKIVKSITKLYWK